MRFLLCGSGTYEILWSLHAALIESGHEAVLALPDVSIDMIDRQIDVVIVLNLFKIPRDTVEMLLDYITTKGKRPLCVHVSLRHPLEEAMAVSNQDVAEIDEWMTRNNAIIWCMCESVTEHCRRLGFTRIIYAPLGLSPWIYGHGRDDGKDIETYKRWMASGDGKIMRQPYSSQKEGELEGVAGDVVNQVLYLGQGWPDDIVGDYAKFDESITREARRVAEAMRATPTLSRLDAMDALSLGDKASDPQWVLNFNQAFKNEFAIKNRVRFIGVLAKSFGRFLSLWGNGWERYGIAARPVSSKPRNFYHLAACCLDVGSLAYDTALFPRTLEILKREGLVMSWRHSDSDRLLGPYRDTLSFDDEKDIEEKVSRILFDPAFRNDVKSSHLKWSFNNLGFSEIIGEIQRLQTR